jgi:signal peptidase II
MIPPCLHGLKLCFARAGLFKLTDSVNGGACLIYYLIALIVFVLDRVTKWLIATRLELHETIPVLGEFFQITSHRNKGAAFGILQNQRWFFIAVTIVVVAGVIWYLRKMVRDGKRLMPLALSLVLGGALGNFFDRALYGEVVDFLQFHFQFNLFGWAVDYIYPIFNVADSAIVVGVCLILLESVLSWGKERKEAAAGVEGKSE